MDIRPELLQNLKVDLEPFLQPARIDHTRGQEEVFSRRSFAATYLLTDIFKKYKGSASKPSHAAESAAISSFLEANDECRDWVPNPVSLTDEYLLGTFRRELNRFLSRVVRNVPDFFAIWDHGKLGPGANQGCASTSFYEKQFSSKLTYSGHESESLIHSYKLWVAKDSRWNSAECIRSAQFGDHRVRGPRCVAVPKTVEKARLVFTEASLSMFAQQGFSFFIRDDLRKYFGIDISYQQETNRRLAQVGSFDSSLATIDLSSASDRISYNLLDWALEPEVFSFLKIFRSSEFSIDSGWLKQNCMYTQGNALTFPIQTAVFAAVVRSGLELSGYDLKDCGRAGSLWSVFGDDIICPRNIFPKVVRLLNLIGGKCNLNKTFVEGHFRESCGRDYWCGEAVRPIYIKDLTCEAGLYVAINQLNRWSSEMGIPLVSSIDYLCSKTRKFLVPLWEQDDSGIRTRSQEVGDYDSHGRWRYRKLVPKVKSIIFNDDSITLPGGHSQRVIFNDEAIGLCYLAGYIRRGKIGLRSDRVPYICTRSVTSNWDYQARELPFIR